MRSTIEEIDESVRCIGAAVRDYSGRVIAAMSIAGPSVRITKETVPTLAVHVINAAHSLSDQLGYSSRVTGLVSESGHLERGA